jgi:hypothetical protein
MLMYILVVLSNNNSVTPFDRVEVGYWIYLLVLGIVIVGSMMVLRTLSTSFPPQAQREVQQPPCNGYIAHPFSK